MFDCSIDLVRHFDRFENWSPTDSTENWSRSEQLETLNFEFSQPWQSGPNTALANPASVTCSNCSNSLFDANWSDCLMFAHSELLKIFAVFTRPKSSSGQ